MKISLTSRLCRFLGKTIIGKPADLFGVDVPDFWLMHYDIDPIRPGQPEDPAWLKLRIAYAYLRRHLLYRVGYITSAMLAVVFIIVLAISTHAISNMQVTRATHRYENAVQQQNEQRQQRQAQRQGNPFLRFIPNIQQNGSVQ